MGATSREESVTTARRRIAENPHAGVVDLYSKRLPYYEALKAGFEEGRPIRLIVEIEVAVIDPGWSKADILANVPTYLISAIDDAEHLEFEHFDPKYLVDAHDLTVWYPDDFLAQPVDCPACWQHDDTDCTCRTCRRTGIVRRDLAMRWITDNPEGGWDPAQWTYDHLVEELDAGG